MENHWKVSTNYVRAQRNKADITLWEDQSVLIAKNIKYGDANLIVRAVNSYEDLLEACKAVAKGFVESYGDFHYADYEGIILKAIAKAEGGNP